ncbi:insulin-like growth factor-binding protein 6b [Latimeria chalumnae]|uniref:insulin-like growth factor-binding protein 6b n=1 Tax=Latimeria chalumnae TaxID=7897 RepID=UPI00313AD759
MAGIRVLCLLALLAPWAQGAEPALRCPGCPPPEGCLPPPEGCDPAREAEGEPCGQAGPCARAAGEPCGVYTPSCAPGLHCIPRAGERTPLHALLQGRGVCSEAARIHPGTEPEGATQNEHGVEDVTFEPVEEENVETAESQHETSNRPWNKHHQSVKTDKEMPPQISLDTDTKQETEVAPCRQHLDQILQGLKSAFFPSTKGIYIPNCDTKGFYRKKQCRSSKGKKKGLCWCVDKFGHPRPSPEGTEGNPHCSHVDSE